MWGKFKIESNHISISFSGFDIAKRYDEALELIKKPTEVHDVRSTIVGFAIPEEDKEDD